jgi:hypothetical protein
MSIKQVTRKLFYSLFIFAALAVFFIQPAAAMEAGMAEAQLRECLTPLHAPEEALFGNKVITQVFRNIFYIICKNVVDSPNLAEIKECLESPETISLIDRAVEQVKTQFCRRYERDFPVLLQERNLRRTLTQYSCIGFSERHLGNSRDLKTFKTSAFATLKKETRLLHEKILRLISIIDQEIDSGEAYSLLNNAESLCSAVEQPIFKRHTCIGCANLAGLLVVTAVIATSIIHNE